MIIVNIIKRRNNYAVRISDDGGWCSQWFFFQLLANAQKDRHEQFVIASKNHKAYEESINNARSYNNNHSNWVRRFIVIVSYTIAIFLVVAGLFVPTNILIETPIYSILGLFSWGGELEVLKVSGVVAYPWISHGIMGIISFYFGQKPAKRGQ